MMRRMILLPLTLLFIIIVTAVACRRSSASPGIPGMTGVLVENSGCGHDVVQLLSGPITDSSVLVKAWTDTVTNKSFMNVFTVRDWITFQQANVSVGDTFTFTLNGPDPNAGKIYYTCMIAPYPSPADSNTVTSIQKIGSGTTINTQ